MTTVELTQREIKLLLKYAYPFEEAEAELEKYRNKSGYHLVALDNYDIPMLIADLVYSAKNINSEMLLQEIDGICTVLDSSV